MIHDRPMRRVARGFSSVELGILTTIVGILSSMAIPVYQDYAVRSQVASGLSGMSSITQAVADTYARTGALPDSRVAANLPAAPNSTQSDYVSAVQIGPQGIVTLTYGNDADERLAGRALQLIPQVAADGKLVWRCRVDAPTTISASFLPTSCRPTR
jgi:type IV pilus assembly protein PilA